MNQPGFPHPRQRQQQQQPSAPQSMVPQKVVMGLVDQCKRFYIEVGQSKSQGEEHIRKLDAAMRALELDSQQLAALMQQEREQYPEAQPDIDRGLHRLAVWLQAAMSVASMERDQFVASVRQQEEALNVVRFFQGEMMRWLRGQAPTSYVSQQQPLQQGGQPMPPGYAAPQMAIPLGGQAPAQLPFGGMQGMLPQAAQMPQLPQFAQPQAPQLPVAPPGFYPNGVPPQAMQQPMMQQPMQPQQQMPVVPPPPMMQQPMQPQYAQPMMQQPQYAQPMMQQPPPGYYYPQYPQQPAVPAEVMPTNQLPVVQQPGIPAPPPMMQVPPMPMVSPPPAPVVIAPPMHDGSNGVQAVPK